MQGDYGGGDILNRNSATDEPSHNDTLLGTSASDCGTVSEALVDDVTQSNDKKPARKGAVKKAARGTPAKGGSDDVGQLLRGAYREAVDEAIPNDLMDLLKKLQ